MQTLYHTPTHACSTPAARLQHSNSSTLISAAAHVASGSILALAHPDHGRAAADWTLRTIRPSASEDTHTSASLSPCTHIRVIRLLSFHSALNAAPVGPHVLLVGTEVGARGRALELPRYVEQLLRVATNLITHELRKASALEESARSLPAPDTRHLLLCT